MPPQQCSLVTHDGPTTTSARTATEVAPAHYTADGRPRDPYTVDMIGTPEWGEQHTKLPNRDAANFETAFYRGNCGTDGPSIQWTPLLSL